MPITAEQTKLLAQMRADNQRAGAPFVTTAFWDKETATFDKLFQATGINSVENEYFNTRFSGLQPDDPKLYRWCLWMYYKAIQQRDVLNLLERIPATLDQASSEAAPAMQYKDGSGPIPMSRVEHFQGKPVYPDLLFSIDDFYNLVELDPRVATHQIVVADLGAGWGRLGYVLLHANPHAHYVVLDIPETLLIATQHLPPLLKNFSVGHYATARNLPVLDRETLLTRQLWLLGCHDLARLAASSIDIMVNVASFQEMPPAQVNAYLQLFDSAALGGSVYLRNARLGAMSGIRDLEIPEDWTVKYSRDTRVICDMYEAGYHVS